jgi:hypothetical protein
MTLRQTLGSLKGPVETIELSLRSGLNLLI